MNKKSSTSTTSSSSNSHSSSDDNPPVGFIFCPPFDDLNEPQTSTGVRLSARALPNAQDDDEEEEEENSSSQVTREHEQDHVHQGPARRRRRPAPPSAPSGGQEGLEGQDDSWWSTWWRTLSSTTSWLFGSSPSSAMGASVVAGTARSSKTALKRTLKRAVVVGIHGWGLLRNLLGAAPHGLSAGFCANAASAIRETCGREVDILEVPLAFHGVVSARIEHHLSVLEDLRQQLRDAELVVFASHSQGTVVSGLLLDELVQRGWLDPLKQSVCVVAMAGIHHGPYPDLPSDFLSSTRELFEFCSLHSDLAQDYLGAVENLVRGGVRFFCVASWRDQVVPLYSALLHGVHSGESKRGSPASRGPRLKPRGNICRALFIEHRLYREHDFALSLVGLCVALRNAGHFSEVLMHLAGFFRGRLVTWAGSHSAIHREPEVYRRGLSWVLEQPLGGVPDDSVRIDSGSLVYWTSMFRESFTSSSLNTFLLLERCQEVLDVAQGSRDERIKSLLGDVRSNFANWQPRGRHQRHLHAAIAPLFSAEIKSNL